MKHGDRDSFTGPWFDRVPPELNDLLHEHVPGPDNRTFRLEIRKAYWACTTTGKDYALAFHGPHQQAVVETVNEMITTWRALHNAGTNGWVGLAMAKTERLAKRGKP